MRLPQHLLITRLTALVALATSASLLAAHLFPNHGFCGFESACDRVFSSRLGELLGVPLSLLGIAIFVTIFKLSLSPALRETQWLRRLALAAGAGGLSLILLQVALLQSLCPFCMVVDLSALVLACIALASRRDGPRQVPTGWQRSLWLAAPVVALGFGVALGSAGSWLPNHETHAPAEIQSLWVADKITIVEIADFDCPHCRYMDTVLRNFLDGQDARIHFTRLTAPMPKHPQARHASRAYLCALAQGKGDEMAAALFKTDDLTPQSCEQLAVSLGVSRSPFRACVADLATDQRLDADLAWVKIACPQGLPAIWVQDRLLSGVQSITAIETAVRDAERRFASQGRR